MWDVSWHGRGFSKIVSDSHNSMDETKDVGTRPDQEDFQPGFDSSVNYYVSFVRRLAAFHPNEAATM